MTRIRPWFLLLAVLLLAAFLRFWRIDTIPPGFHLDESFEGLEAWRIFSDASYRPIFLTGNFGVPPLNAYANALMFAIFHLFGGEVGPTAMRVTAACFGMLGIVAVYGLAREIQLTLHRDPLITIEPPPATRHPPSLLPLFSAASLALMRWHLHFSRIGIEPIIVPLLWTGACWLLLRGWRMGSRWSFAGSGLLLALTMYTYQGAWIIPLLMLPLAGHLLIWSWVKGGSGTVEQDSFLFYGDLSGAPMANRTKPQNFAGAPDRSFIDTYIIQNPRILLSNLLLSALVALLLVVPLGCFFWNNPTLLLLRPTQIVVGGEASAAANATILDQAWATAKMFAPWGTFGDLDPRRNLPGQPALDLFLTLPFYIGLLLALWRIRHPAYALLLIGLIGLLLPGIVSEYAPHFHRVLGAAAPVAILCGFGLDWLWHFFAKWRFPTVAALRWLTVLILFASGLTTTRDYFVRWATLPDLYYAFDSGLWEIGQWMATQPAQTPIYLTPRSLDHPTLAFALATHETKPAPISFDGRYIFPLTSAASDQPQLYVAIQEEDFRTRLVLPELFPDAQVVREWRDSTGKVYATAYQRMPNTLAQTLPQVALNQMMGDGIRLVGYDIKPAQPKPGEILYLQLYWEVDAPPMTNWTVFTHLVDPAQSNAPPLAGHDSQPGAGSLITTRWQAGWRILDEYQIALPADLSPGTYQLQTGMYTPEGLHLPDNGAVIELGAVRIE